jgi:hypothetical protein
LKDASVVFANTSRALSDCGEVNQHPRTAEMGDLEIRYMGEDKNGHPSYNPVFSTRLQAFYMVINVREKVITPKKKV